MSITADNLKNNLWPEVAKWHARSPYLSAAFADEKTRDLFGNVNSKSARRIPNTAWKAARRKLKQLDLVTRLDDLQIPPGNDLHALKGDQAAATPSR